MKRIFLCAASSMAFLAVVCWGNVKPLYAADKPSAEIRHVQIPQNWSTGGTFIPVSIKNNTSQQVKGVRLVLYAYDKEKKKMFESRVLGMRGGDWENRFTGGGSSLAPKVSVKLYCGFPEPRNLYSKEFKEKYGKKPGYYVVELYADNNLIDVMANPKDFFKHSQKGEYKKRLEEWEEIKRQ